MTLHCEKKTKNTKLFLSNGQLLSEVATESYSGQISSKICDPNLNN